MDSLFLGEWGTALERMYNVHLKPLPQGLATFSP